MLVRRDSVRRGASPQLPYEPTHFNATEQSCTGRGFFFFGGGVYPLRDTNITRAKLHSLRGITIPRKKKKKNALLSRKSIPAKRPNGFMVILTGAARTVLKYCLKRGLLQTTYLSPWLQTHSHKRNELLSSKSIPAKRPNGFM